MSGEAPPAGPVHVVLVTGPDRETLEELARTVVNERLAACVNVLGDVGSVYRWKDEVEEADESLAVIKTTEERLEGLRRRVLDLHPYEVPEFVAVRVDRGDAAYLEWVAGAVAGA